MTNEQQKLLLATARIVRARLLESLPTDANMRDHGHIVDDIEAMNEALAPFDPKKGEPANEASAA